MEKESSQGQYLRPEEQEIERAKRMREDVLGRVRAIQDDMAKRGPDPDSEKELQKLYNTLESINDIEESELDALQDVLYLEQEVPTDPVGMQEWRFRAEARIADLKRRLEDEPERTEINFIREWEIDTLEEALEEAYDPNESQKDEEE